MAPGARNRQRKDKMATLDLQVGASTDDAVTYESNDWWGLTNSHFGAGNNGATYYKCGSGARFTNVTIPQGATIITAYLTLTASQNQSSATCYSKISAEDVDDAATFADDQAAFITRFNNHTTARVDWDAIGAWALDTEYNSPEIKTIIQEIVNRAGWSSGSAVVVFWEDFDNLSSSGAIRFAHSYDGSTTKAPKLHIEYTAITEKSSSDSGAGVDAYVSLEKTEAKTSSDTGSGVESTPAQTATLTGNETGSGIEALVARLLAAFDTGSGVEVGGLLKDLVASELGRGFDSLIAKIEMPTKGGGMRLWT